MPQAKLKFVIAGMKVRSNLFTNLPLQLNADRLLHPATMGFALTKIISHKNLLVSNFFRRKIYTVGRRFFWYQ